MDQDFLICSVILQHGCEEVVPCVDWVQEMFTPLPVELSGRAFSDIAQPSAHVDAVSQLKKTL